LSSGGLGDRGAFRPIAFCRLKPGFPRWLPNRVNIRVLSSFLQAGREAGTANIRSARNDGGYDVLQVETRNMKGPRASNAAAGSEVFSNNRSRDGLRQRGAVAAIRHPFKQRSAFPDIRCFIFAGRANNIRPPATRA